MVGSDRRVQARAFLRKAREYLVVAEDSLERDRLTAAAGNAIHAGISAKDAIVLSLTGNIGKGRDHRQAVKELRAALEGEPEATQLEKALRELVSAKADVEYGVFMIGDTKAKALVRRAQALVNAATRLSI